MHERSVPAQSSPEETIQPDVVREWMAKADEIAPFDEPVALGDGSSAVLKDAVYVRDDPSNKYGPTSPIVVLEMPDGSRKYMPTAEFLHLWPGFDLKEFSASRLAEETAKVQEASRQRAIAEAALHATEERQREAVRKRAEYLFRPLDPEGDNDGDVNYDRLFSEKELPSTSVENAAVRRPKERLYKVTDESEEKAEGVLREAMLVDEDLADLIENYPTVKNAHLSQKDLVRLIRTDKALRVEIGIYLLDKLGKISVYTRMPWRIASDNGENEKSSNHPGLYERLGKVRSTEYAVLIALSMLDGTFDYRRNDMDRITYDPKTDRGGGQHRTAASSLLKIAS